MSRKRPVPRLMSADRLAIFERDRWVCGEPVDRNADPTRDDRAPNVDHIIPVSDGGTNDPANLQTAHRGCNTAKAARRPWWTV